MAIKLTSRITTQTLLMNEAMETGHTSLLFWVALLHSLFFFFFFFFFFLGPQLWHMEIPRLGVELNQSYSCCPTPQPQQLGIWAAFVTYVAAHSNAGSLTHWVSPGIKPTFSWILVRCLTCYARAGTPALVLKTLLPATAIAHLFWMKMVWLNFSDSLLGWVPLAILLFFRLAEKQNSISK